ncbi:kinase-like domain-containing protein [Gamsiella multidivaricata]|uniref:kinase-like domain-containing protein n=1 Tax=Gamsiella multidivaricata TaxID=101098 RepID=UPI00221EDCDC|nr:kinase-like domain-containing protein [Gamsiella multidivaricata]KAI7823536.1 kinase-like domain-containing protein [Gamsiella multidivaricata]
MGNGSSRDYEDAFENEVNLLNFKLLKSIGRGSFGKVRMVERRDTGKVYALKYISKAQVIKMDAVRNVLRERQILETLDHPFVVNMRFAFQDDEYMYMCMDLMMGGDLRFHLNRRQFGEDVVRFWVAELSSAIIHLHSQGIVHRDIKPDNVLLDEKGHAHLTDFNIGCKLTPQKPMLTSQSGTVAYMAPEVFVGSGYGTSVDWWALGVMFYEAIYNRRPFQTDSVSDLKKAIPTQTIEYPEKEGLSRECISAMRGFLTRDPKERLGIKGGMEGIRRHPFFQAGAYQGNLDNWWYMLETKQLTPKFQPSTEQNNFDATFDLEELLLDDEPLTYRSTRKRAQRMIKEKDKALKEENARLKAEQEAALAATELAMQAMAVSAEEYNASNTWDQQQNRSEKNKLMKKRSKLYLGGGKDSDNSNSSSTNSSHIHLSQPLPMPQNYLQQQQQPSQHAGSPQPRQPQYQSIGDSTTGGRGMPIPPNVQFPTPPPPSASRHSGQAVRSQPGAYGRHPTASLPPPPTQNPPLNPPQQPQQKPGVPCDAAQPSPKATTATTATAGTAAVHLPTTVLEPTTTVPRPGPSTDIPNACHDHERERERKDVGGGSDDGFGQHVTEGEVCVPDGVNRPRVHDV